MNCSLSRSSVHGIFQARTLEWVAISFSRGSSQPRDWTLVSCIAGRLLLAEPQGKDPNEYYEKHSPHRFDILSEVNKLLKTNTRNRTWIHTLMYRTVLWTLWERERGGRFGRMTLKHVKYHVRNELPVQVRYTILDAWGWCTGTTQRDGMGKEEGEGFRMGNTCIPVEDSFWYLAKLIQLCKV